MPRKARRAVAARCPGMPPPPPTRRSTARSPGESREVAARPVARRARAGVALTGLRRARALDRARVGPAGDLPPAPRRQGREAVLDAEVPHDGCERRRA